MSEPEVCQVCGDEGHDRRTLVLSYFYDLKELSGKFHGHDGSFSIRTCKDCRGDFLAMLRRWCAGELIEPAMRTGDEFVRNIPVREDGRVVFVTELEWRERHGDRQPVRLPAKYWAEQANEGAS